MTGSINRARRITGLTIFIISYLLFMGAWHPGYVSAPQIDLYKIFISVIVIATISTVITIGVTK